MNLTNPLFKDIIVAGAIGDAFGYLVEFDPIDWIDEKFPDYTLDGVAKVRPSWNISDDTQMTLFCLEGILKNKDVEEIDIKKVNSDIYISYLDWYYTQNATEAEPLVREKLLDYKVMYRREAPGNTCMSALYDGQMGIISHPINDSKGCGGIMRVAPVAFLGLSLEDTFKLGAMQAATTHGHPEGYLSAGYFAALLKILIEGGKFNVYAADKLYTISSYYDKSERFLKYIEHMTSHVLSDNELLEGHALTTQLGQGWVGEEALGVALYCATKTDSFADCLRLAARHNGDSDSTASIAGQLWVAGGGDMSHYADFVKKLNAVDAIKHVLAKM